MSKKHPPKIVVKHTCFTCKDHKPEAYGDWVLFIKLNRSLWVCFECMVDYELGKSREILPCR